MSDEKTVEALVGGPDGPDLIADQWYAVRVSTFVRRTAAGRLETKAYRMNVVKVDSPDEPMPPPDETAEPK